MGLRGTEGVRREGGSIKGPSFDGPTSSVKQGTEVRRDVNLFT